MAGNSTTTITKSVITDNTAGGNGGGLFTVGSATFAIGQSILAGNHGDPIIADEWGFAGGVPTSPSLGDNLFSDLIDTIDMIEAVLATSDYKSDASGYIDPTQIVTSVADSFNHADDAYALSLREAIDNTNTASGGQQEIWLSAWDFALTRDRATFGNNSLTDTSIEFGDLDIFDDLVIRGITGETSVAWSKGAAARYDPNNTGRIDAVFDLLGDYNNSGQADYNNVSAADYTVWRDSQGSGSGTSIDWEVFAADGDDDGDVDQDDWNIWASHYGNTLDLFDIAVT